MRANVSRPFPVLRLALSVVVVAALAACAASPSTSRVTPRGADSPISLEEIEGSGSDNVHALVQKLRPHWLTRSRPQALGSPGSDVLVVYLDNARLGGPEALRQVSTSGVAAVTYLSPSAAQFRFGSGHLNGAIVISSRSG